MSDRRIDEFPELSELNDTDIALISSGNNTYAVKVSTLKEVFGKSTITPVPDPSASGTSITFIDTISQDAQGVIKATKKTVGVATSNPYQSGLMSATDKEKFDKILTGFKSDMQYYLDLPYPIKAGTHALDNNLGNTADIIWARYDIPNAEANTRDKWLGYRPPAYAYVKNTRMELDDLKARATAAEAQRMAMYPTDTAEGATVAIIDGADDVPVKALKVSIRPVQSGSGDPSPDNVRAISGWTGATVTRLGKNLANIADNTYTNSGVTFTVSGGAVQMTGASTGTINRTIGTVRLSAGVKYTISGTGASGITDANVLRIDLRNTGGSVIASGDSYNGFTYTPAADVTAQVNIRLASGQTIDATLYPQVEAGRKATAFEPYAPTSWAVDWSGAAGTVYGGVLDVTRGLLTVDKVMITIDGSDSSRLASFNTDSSNFNRVQSNIYNDIGITNIMFECCDRFKPIALDSTESKLYKIWNSANAPRMFFGLPKTVTSIDEAKAWFAENPTHVVAKIASPQTYQLTPVQVHTLLGANMIYVDHGDVTVTYRADPTLQHDNLDAGDVGFSLTAQYLSNTVGAILKEVYDNLYSVIQDVGRHDIAIDSTKTLVYNNDGTVTWEDAPS